MANIDEIRWREAEDEEGDRRSPLENWIYASPSSRRLRDVDASAGAVTLDALDPGGGVDDVFVNATGEYANATGANNDEVLFEALISIVVPFLFALIFIVGVVGNTLVVLVIARNRNGKMRSSTNVLILNLSVADLLFIIFCIPFTAVQYASRKWVLGTVLCKAVNFTQYWTAYASIYLLVLMSFDRFLAVVFPMKSSAYRTERIAWAVTSVVWLVFAVVDIPVGVAFMVHEYEYNGQRRAICLAKDRLEMMSADPVVRVDARQRHQVFTACFLTFGYLLPILLISVLYGVLVHKLLTTRKPGCQAAQAHGDRKPKSAQKKRVTWMVVAVILVFALCWLPNQINFMLDVFGEGEMSPTKVIFQLVGNCLAYINSCVNPILYAFLSDNFRSEFKKLLGIADQKKGIKSKILHQETMQSVVRARYSRREDAKTNFAMDSLDLVTAGPTAPDNDPGVAEASKRAPPTGADGKDAAAATSVKRAKMTTAETTTEASSTLMTNESAATAETLTTNASAAAAATPITTTVEINGVVIIDAQTIKDEFL